MILLLLGPMGGFTWVYYIHRALYLRRVRWWMRKYTAQVTETGSPTPSDVVPSGFHAGWSLQSLPGIGVLFDIDALGRGFYEGKAWRLFMSKTDPERLGACLLRHGDTCATLAGSARRFCIAVYGPEASVRYIRNVFADLEDKGLAPKARRLLEKRELASAPLSLKGGVDGSGRFVEDSWDRSSHDLCREAGWGYAPVRVPPDLDAHLRTELEALKIPGWASQERRAAPWTRGAGPSPAQRARRPRQVAKATKPAKSDREGRSGTGELFEALFDVVCCIMCADFRVTKAEEEAVHNVLEKAKAPWTRDEIERRIGSFLQRAKNDGLSNVVAQTCEKLTEFKQRGEENTFVRAIEYIARADGIVNVKERDLCERFKSLLAAEPTARRGKETWHVDIVEPEDSSRRNTSSDAEPDDLERAANRGTTNYEQEIRHQLHAMFPRFGVDRVRLGKLVQTHPQGEECIIERYIFIDVQGQAPIEVVVPPHESLRRYVEISAAALRDAGAEEQAAVAETRDAPKPTRPGGHDAVRTEDLFEILLDAVCCVMCADAKVTRKEREAVYEILRKTKAPWDADEINTRIDGFVQRVRDAGLAQVIVDTCKNLPGFRQRGKESILLRCIDYMSRADGTVDDKEKKLCERFRSALAAELGEENAATRQTAGPESLCDFKEVRTRSPEEAAETLCTHAICSAPIVDEAQIRKEYANVSQSWGSKQLFDGTDTEMHSLVLKNLRKLAASPGFESFRVAIFPEQKCAQISAFFPGCFVGVRAWRTRDKLFVCGDYRFAL